MIETPGNSSQGMRPFGNAAYVGGVLPREFTLAEVTGVISRVTGLAPDIHQVARLSGDLLGTINSNPHLRVAGINSAAVLSYVAQHITKEITEMMDPAKRAELERRKEEAGPTSVAMAKAGILGESPLGRRAAAERESAESSARFGAFGTQGFTQTQMLARDVALKHGLEWAANNPDLLRLGPSAIRALADVHLRQDSYERFKQGGLKPETIVAGARWAKRNGIDYNEFSNTYNATQNQLAAPDKNEHNKALERFFSAPSGTEQDRAKASEEFNKSMDGIKARNPQAAPQIEREQQMLKTVKKAEHAATVTAHDKETKAQAKEVKTDAKAADNNDFLASLNEGKATEKSPEKPAAKPDKPDDKKAAGTGAGDNKEASGQQVQPKPEQKPRVAVSGASASKPAI